MSLMTCRGVCVHDPSFCLLPFYLQQFTTHTSSWHYTSYCHACGCTSFLSGVVECRTDHTAPCAHLHTGLDNNIILQNYYNIILLCVLCNTLNWKKCLFSNSIWSSISECSLKFNTLSVACTSEHPRMVVVLQLCMHVYVHTNKGVHVYACALMYMCACVYTYVPVCGCVCDCIWLGVCVCMRVYV